MSYRDLDATTRLADLEQSRDEATARADSLERQLWELRKERNRLLGYTLVFGALPTSGIGSLLGNLAGAIAWAFTDNPVFMLLGGTLGFAFAFIIHVSWNVPKDGLWSSTSRTPPSTHLPR